MARAMKDSGIEWIGEIPEEWSIRKMDMVCSVVTDYVASGSFADLAKNVEYLDEPNYAMLVRTADVSNKARTSKAVYINKQAYDFLRNSNLFGGELLFPNIGAVGDVYIVPKLYERMSLAPNSIICKTVYNDKYYYYYFLCQAGRQSLIEISQSTAQAKFNKTDFKQIRALVPPLAEQNKLVEFLDKECARIDVMIEQTRASIEEYKKLKQSVITQAVTKGIRPGRKMKDSGVEWIGEIPEDWKLLSLGAVTESMRNGYVGPTKDLFIDEGVKYIQSLHIKDGGIDFSRQQYYVSEEWANVHPKIKENDILIVQTGDIGNVGLVTAEYDGCNCHALIIATPRTDLIFPQYLTFFLRSTVGKELLLVYKTGALLPHLNSGKIKFASICVPSLQEQKEIVNYLNAKCIAIDNLISKKELLASELESYKKSLIFEYVTGKKEA